MKHFVGLKLWNINLVLTLNYIVGGSESHFNGCFRLFAPNFWEMEGPTNGNCSFYESGGSTKSIECQLNFLIACEVEK